MTAAIAIAGRTPTAKMVLDLGLVFAVMPAIVGLGAAFLVRLGVIDWWTGYGQVLIGDATHLGLALQAALVAIATVAASLAVTLWAGPTKFYARAMLNMTITAATLIVLLYLRG